MSIEDERNAAGEEMDTGGDAPRIGTWEEQWPAITMLRRFAARERFASRPDGKALLEEVDRLRVANGQIFSRYQRAASAGRAAEEAYRAIWMELEKDCEWLGIDKKKAHTFREIMAAWRVKAGLLEMEVASGKDPLVKVLLVGVGFLLGLVAGIAVAKL